MADGATLRSVSIWTDTEANSGTRESIVQYPLQIDERIEIPEHGGLGREELTLQLPVSDNAWSDVQEGKVLRVELTDDEVTEWRIVEVTKRRLKGGGKLGVLKCDSIAYDMARRTPIIQRVESGRADLDFKVLNLTPDEWIDQIITGTPDWPSWITKGTVDASDDLSIFADGITAARMLDIITEQSPTSDGTPHEWTLRRNGATDYKIDVLTERGSVSRTPYLALTKSLISADVKSTAREQVTRIYPRGGGPQGFRAYIGPATWSVDSVSGSTVTLSDPAGGDGPVGFDDQLNGLYLEKANGSTTEITDSDAGNDTVTVSDASNISNGDTVQIRKNSSGDELVYLEHPSNKSTYGLQVGTLDRQDIAPVANLVTDVASAFCDVDSDADGLADGWSKVGSPTVTQETAQQYHKHGTASMKVVASQDEGIVTDAITVAPTALDPFFAAQFAIRVESGEGQVQLIDDTNSKNYPRKCNDAGRWSSDRTERIDIQPGVNFNDENTTSMKLRIVARDGAATFYVDAVQLIQDSTPARTIFDGRGANKLWQAANRRLADVSSPETSYDVEAVDLYRADVDTWPDDQIEPGNTIRVSDPGLSEDVEVRVVERRRTITHPDVNKRNELRITVDNTRRRITDRTSRQNLPELADEHPPEPSADKTEGTPVSELDGSTETITWSLDATVGGDGGTATLSVEDSELRVTDLEFQVKESASDFSGTWSTSWTTTTGTPGTDTSLERTKDVAAQEKHISAFKARITYLDRNCDTITKVTEPVFFDFSILPSFEVFTAAVNDDGTVTANIKGDPDTASVKIEYDFDNDSSVDETHNTDARAVEDTSTGTVAEGAVCKITTTLYTETGQTGTSVSEPIKIARATDSDTAAPSVDVDQTQSGNTGSLDLTIEDPDTVVTDVEFQKKTGAGAYGGSWVTTWDRSTGTAGTDTTLTRGEDIAFKLKHNVSIKWRVKWTDPDGNNRITADTVPFDIDEIPQVQITGTGQDEDDTVLIGLVGDEDTADIHVTWNIGTSPSQPADPVNTDTALGAARGVLDTGATANVGEVIWIKALGADSGGTMAPSSEVAEAKLKISEGELDPRIQEDATQSGSTGSLDLTIEDPQTRITAIEFQKKTDAGDFGGTWLSTWDRSTGSTGTNTSLTRGEDITLVEKHNVAIKWRVQYDDLTGTTQTIGNVVPFDLDQIAEVNSLSVTIDESTGNAIVAAGGDDDTNSIHIRVGDGSTPADPDSSVSDDAQIDARTGVVDTGVTITAGNNAEVKARGSIDSVANTSSADLGPVKRSQQYRPTPDPALSDVDLGTVFDDGTDVDYPVSWTPNSAVNDTDHDVVIECYENGSFRTSSTVTDPATTTSTTVTDSGGGDGSGSDRSSVVVILKDSGGAVASYQDESKLQAT